MVGSGSGDANATATYPASVAVTNAGIAGVAPAKVIGASAARSPHRCPVQKRHGPVVIRSKRTRATNCDVVMLSVLVP